MAVAPAVTVGVAVEAITRQSRPGWPAGGTLASGGRLPSIAVLRRQHNHSRQTVGKAMRILEGEGLIYRVPGLGYYISQRAVAAPRD